MCVLMLNFETRQPQETLFSENRSISLPNGGIDFKTANPTFSSFKIEASTLHWRI